MRPVVRILLLFLVALGMMLPMAGGPGVSGGGAEAAARPCPSKSVVRTCLIGTPSEALAPRGTAAVDAPCQAKAIGVESPALAAPATCGPPAFDVAPASWSAWSPPTPARPPRS